MFAGAATALVLVVLAFGGAVEPVITGLALLGFASGWALLAFTTRRTRQPQRWAWVPATALAVVGLASRRLPTVGRASCARPGGCGPPCCWPQSSGSSSRRVGRCTNWSRSVVLYPVLALAVLAAVGGGYEKLSEVRDSSAS